MCRISLFIFALAIASCFVTWKSETSETINSEVMAQEFLQVEFEVFGMVQGVFFRKLGIADEETKTRLETYPESSINGINMNVHGMIKIHHIHKHTVDKANQLGLRGWCMNTSRGTVLGQMEGEPGKIEEMKRWLKFTGSPMSRIEKAEFRNEKSVDAFSFNGFKVRH